MLSCRHIYILRIIHTDLLKQCRRGFATINSNRRLSNSFLWEEVYVRIWSMGKENVKGNFGIFVPSKPRRNQTLHEKKNWMEFNRLSGSWKINQNCTLNSASVTFCLSENWTVNSMQIICMPPFTIGDVNVDNSPVF